ncbi:MAG: Mov34/MPN/PAD-1 family protein [Promethearchaeota archaeon]
MSKRRSKSKDSDNIVIIKPLAYYKMLVHILRFGNRLRDIRLYKEVMGMLIGYLEGDGVIKNVIIEDAVPISHGGSIEVAFAQEDYITFAQVDEQYAEKNWFTVGWYHSHPGLQIFFSGTDILNQLGWQTPNPSAIGIVFDHTYLEKPGDLGFRTFRLDDPSKGSKSSYHEIETIVEPPDKMEFYIKIMELINSVQSKEPPILEINETLDLFGEIFFPSKSELLAVKPELKLKEILSALHNGISNFLELSIEPLINFLNSWSQEIIKNTMDNNLQMRSDLEDFKNDLGQGLNNLQNNFKFSLTYKLNDLDSYIESRFENFDKDREEINNLINNLKKEVPLKINELFDGTINIALNRVIQILDENSKKLAKIDKKEVKSSENLDQQHKSLENLSKKIKSVEKLISDKIRGFQEISGNIKEQLGTLSKKLTESQNETQTFLSNLSSTTSQLESSIQSLNNKIEELEAEKQELLNKAQNS